VHQGLAVIEGNFGVALKLHTAPPGPDDLNGEEHFYVMSNRMPLGRISRRRGTKNGISWVWSINGVIASPGVMATMGAASTLDEAQAELTKNWRKWLAWSGLQDIE
jgi:hypothetical protein